MRFSVVICAFNVARFLEKSIKELMNQSFDPENKYCVPYFWGAGLRFVFSGRGLPGIVLRALQH